MSDASKKQVAILSAAIEKAARFPIAVGPCKCNLFAGKVAETAGVPYFNSILNTDHDRTANVIFGFIEKATGSPPSGWKILSEKEAQENADSGRFVVGVARSIDQESHGHIVVVVPSTWNRLEQPGTGPWVRDNLHPDRSIRASRRFGATVVKPVYAVWLSDLKPR